MLFIERLEIPSPIVSLRRAESESGSHHYMRWVLLANTRCAARTDERRRKETPLSSDQGTNRAGQQAHPSRHTTAKAETRSDPSL